jgi:hypothetical protein
VPDALHAILRHPEKGVEIVAAVVVVDAGSPRMKNLEVRLAYVLGVALPLLETLRRRTNFSPIAMYVDDYIAGILLVTAARAVARGKTWGPAFLAGAWGILVGGLYGSFFSQVQNPETHDISGLSNWIVVAIKGVIFALAIVCFVLAIRKAAERRPAQA